MPLYKQHPDDTKKTHPVVNNRVLVKKAITPAKEVIYRRPDHVVLNNTGSYAFLYATTGSVGANAPNLIAPYAADANSGDPTEGYVTGSFVNGGGAAEAIVTPFKLEINPVSWVRTDATGTTGDITFVYAGKYIQNETRS